MMIRTLQKRWASAIAASAVAVLSATAAGAGTTIGFGSSVGATNLTSAGAAVDGSFQFQLGTFAGGFVPTSANTDQWLAAWREASDIDGQPLEGNTARYQAQELGDPFPPGMRANSFTSSVTLEHNTPPFDLGGRLYIWGYNRRALPGAAEWILISNPSWVWPDGSSIQPATSYSVSSASIAVLGEISGAGFEMRTAAVTVPGDAADSYEGWLYANFPEVDLLDPAREADVWGEHADPDEDGLSNLMEYFTAGDPGQAASALVLGTPQISDTEVFVEFRRSLSAVGVTGQVEWSTDLESWSRDGIEQDPLGQDAGFETVRASWPIGDATSVFFRLAVEREP